MKPVVSILTASALIFTPLSGYALSVSAEVSTETGTWADNVSWAFQNGTGTLTISGSGEMVQINNSGNPAWNTLGNVSQTDIRKAIIEEGIVNIYMFSFNGCSNLTEAYIPVSVTYIDSFAFNGCGSLTDVYYSGTEEQWHQIQIAEENDSLLKAGVHFNAQLPEQYVREEKKEPSWEDTFSEALYRANYYSTLPFRWNYLQSDLQYFEPCKFLTDSTRMDISTLTWKVVTGTVDTAFDLSKGVELAFEEKDIYAAILLEMLECSSEIEVAGEYGTYSKKAKKVVSFFDDYVSSLYQFGNQDDIWWESLTPDQKTDISEAAIAEYAEDYPWISGLSDYLDDLDNLAQYAEYTDAVLNYFVSGMYLQHLSESTRELLQEMYNTCPKDQNAMKAALKDCCRIVNSADNWDKEIVKGVAGKVARFGLEVVLEQYKEIVVKKAELMCPAIAVLKVAYDGSKLLCNAIFSTDQMVEEYTIMKAVVNLEALIDSVSKNVYNEYHESRTEKKASLLLTAIDMQYAARRVNCDKGAKFADTFSKTIMSQFLMDTNGKRLKALCEKRRDHDLPLFLYDIHTAWIEQIDADHPASALYVEYDTVYRKSVYESICKMDFWESYTSEDLEKRLEELKELYKDTEAISPGA